MRVRDIMTTDPIGVTPDTPLKEAARLMVGNHVSGLPVIDASGRLAGILTEGDFLRREASRGRPRRASLLRVLFGDLKATEAETAGEAMTKSVVTISPSATIGEAARVMASRKVKRLPVVDADRELVGIISRADVVNAFTKPDDVDRLIATTVERFGRLDVMVNNAGGGIKMRKAEDTPYEEWVQLIDFNLTGTFLCCIANVYDQNEAEG